MPCRTQEMKKPIFGTVWGEGGRMNGHSVGLDPEKRILRCSNAWLMSKSIINDLSTPKLGGFGT